VKEIICSLILLIDIWLAGSVKFYFSIDLKAFTKEELKKGEVFLRTSLLIAILLKSGIAELFEEEL